MILFGKWQVEEQLTLLQGGGGPHNESWILANPAISATRKWYKHARFQCLGSQEPLERHVR